MFGNNVNRYQMQQSLISIGDDYWIKNEDGKKVFHVDGKVLRIRQTLIFEDAHGKELYKIQERVLPVHKVMVIESADGDKVAEVKKSMLSAAGDRWEVELSKGGKLVAHGDLFAHEYEISHGLSKAATISKKWFSVSDSYGVEVEKGQDDALLLAVTVVIDTMAHKEK